MIASHLRRFIFVKTIKTAGSSLEMALAKLCGPDDVITPLDAEGETEWKRERGYPGPQHTDLPLRAWSAGNLYMRLRGRRPSFYNHMPATAIRRAVGDGVWSSYFRFTIDRNPWDRIVSQYFWRTRRDAVRPPLAEYLRSTPPEHLSNWHRYSIDGRLAVDRVLRFERLEDEMAALAAERGWPALDPLPRAKGAVRPKQSSYRELLGDAERDLIAAACAREIELLGYTF